MSQNRFVRAQPGCTTATARCFRPPWCRCPNCRSPTPFHHGKVNSLNVNYALVELLALLPPTQAGGADAPSICGNCGTWCGDAFFNEIWGPYVATASSLGEDPAVIPYMDTFILTRLRLLLLTCADEAAATLFCAECKADLCAECSRVVHLPKMFAKHAVVPIAQKPRGSAAAGPVFCNTHQNRPLDLFCIECKVSSIR